MFYLAIAAAAFLALHLVVSGTRVRDAATGLVGEGPYMGLFSLASVAGLIWLGIAFTTAHGSASDHVYWTATPATKIAQLVIQFLAILLIVPGLATPNPTSVRQERTLEKAEVVRGMLRITRHPFLWGAALWAAGHLLVNGDLAGLILFGSILILALFGTASIDAKRRRVLGASWDAFAARTSNVPFAAILGGRQKLAIGEIGGWRLLAAVVVYFALLYAHPHAFGVSPLP